MNNPNYFRDKFESIPGYSKIVLLVFLIEDDKILFKKSGLVNMILINYL